MKNEFPKSSLAGIDHIRPRRRTQGAVCYIERDVSGAGSMAGRSCEFLCKNYETKFKLYIFSSVKQIFNFRFFQQLSMESLFTNRVFHLIQPFVKAWNFGFPPVIQSVCRLVRGISSNNS